MQGELATAEELKQIDTDIRKEIDEATKAAKTDPELDLDELYYDVYVKCLHENIRGITFSDQHQHRNTSKPMNI